MSKPVNQVIELFVLGARLYQELAMSAMTLLPGRTEDTLESV